MANLTQYPPEFSQQAWNWLQNSTAAESTRYLTQGALTQIIDAAYQASLQVEEGRPVLLQMACFSAQGLNQRREYGWDFA